MPVSKTASLLLTLAAAAALTACHGKPDKEEDQRTAEGEVLSTSVSDAMLPVEAPTSTPPAAPKKDVGDKATEDATTDANDIRDAMNALSADKPAPEKPAADPAQ